MTKNILTIILFTLSTLLCRGQYVDNSPTLLKKLGIRSLIVCTDSLCESCPVDYNDYDTQGRQTYHYEAMMEDRWESFYSKDKELFSIYYFITDDGKITMMDTTFYFYNKDNSVKYFVRKECSDGEKLITKLDTIYPDGKPNKRILKNPVYDNKDKLTSHIVDGINRSCITQSKGDHTLKYYYKKNGLINKIAIFKPTKELYMTWYFIYTDKGKYRRQ